MIVVWGAGEDPPVAAVLGALGERGADVIHVEDHALGAIGYEVRLGARVDGWIDVGGGRIELDTIDAIYLRPGEQVGDSAAAATLLAVAESSPATVVNRPSAGRSNLSKPFQSALLEAAGVTTPDTVVTSDPVAAKAFLARHGRIVYKSISGRRSIVNTIDTGEFERLDRIGHGPVQLQQWIGGLDVRVHVVGERCVATAVRSGAADYRYAALDGTAVELEAFEIPDSLAAQLVGLTQRMGLLLSGIDLRRTADGRWFCFEVNPSPGFTYYEDHTGQPIAAAVAGLLVGGDEPVARRTPVR